MSLKQGDILWIDLNSAKGTETRKKRPCLIVSNNQYNRFFNTVLVIPISTADKYQTNDKYVKSPLFMPINEDNIHGVALLQHIRAIDPAKRSDSKVVATLPQQAIRAISTNIKQFF